LKDEHRRTTPLVPGLFTVQDAGMTEPPDGLLPTTASELEQALSHALRFDGRKSFKPSGELMAKITAGHLVECLRVSGFVVLKKPPGLQSSIAAMPSHLFDAPE